MTTLAPNSYDFYVDKAKDHPVTLQINTKRGSFRIPLTSRTCGDLGAVLLSHAAAL